VLDAWDKFLLTPFKQIERYGAYVSGQAAFETHQGLKGPEISARYGHYGWYRSARIHV